jgi:small subunit ribosomal protein S20
MPITKSAKKSLRVSRTKKAQNDQQRLALAKALQKVDVNSVNQTVSLIDKAAKTNLIHANKAARMKSQLAKKFGTPKTIKTDVKTVKKSPVKSKAKTKKIR